MTIVTVVIPAFNAAATIRQALDSIREQTLQDVEVILVDDGSSDGTPEIARAHAGNLRLEIVQQRNAGPGVARNKGIRSAQGRHCAFLDADDVMLPGRLELEARMLDDNPGMGLVHTDLMTFDDGGIIHQSRWAFSRPKGGHVLEDLLLDNFITTSTVMAPRARLLEAGLFPENRRISEDYKLWLGMAARWEIGYIDQPLVKYRRAPDSLSGNKYTTAIAALEVIEEFRQEHPQFCRDRRRVMRKTMAAHLSTAGAAAWKYDRRRQALGYLGRALFNDPLRADSWKWLAKALLRPAPQAPVKPRKAG